MTVLMVMFGNAEGKLDGNDTEPRRALEKEAGLNIPTCP